jgi:hypothetical protein
MEINIKWHRVYMFCRKYGESVIPMYIGRSKNMYNRIWEH